MRLIDVLIRVDEATLPQIQGKFDDQFMNQRIKTDELATPRLMMMTPYGEMIFKVNSSTGTGAYAPIIRFVDWQTVVPNLPEGNAGIGLLTQNCNVKLKCDCPSFKMHGYQYILTTTDSALNPEVRPPNKTNPHQQGDVCKHLRKCIERLPNYNKTIAKNIALFKTFNQ